MCMIPFCETWYCCISLWYWMTFLSGHVILYLTIAHLYYLSYNYPYMDAIMQCLLITLVGTWIFTTWIPFFMILVRTERREPIAAIVFTIGCFLPVSFALGSLIFSLHYPTEMFYKHLLNDLKDKYKENRNASREKFWLTQVERDHACCGIIDWTDYVITNTLPINCPCINTAEACKNTRGCYEFINETRQFYLLLIHLYDSWLLLGCVLTMVIYLFRFRWIRNLDIVILTGRVYIKTSNGIKSYPEIDTSEAVSYSSSN